VGFDWESQPSRHNYGGINGHWSVIGCVLIKSMVEGETVFLFLCLPAKVDADSGSLARFGECDSSVFFCCSLSLIILIPKGEREQWVSADSGCPDHSVRGRLSFCFVFCSLKVTLFKKVRRTRH